MTRDDGTAVSLTLSNYCPSAAALLFRADVPLAVVELPGAAVPAEGFDGLRRDGWPPLLRPERLMDVDAYLRWERHAVAVFAAAEGPESGLATLARDAERLRAWRPGTEPLADLVGGLAALGAVHAGPPEELGPSEARHAEVLECTPEAWRQAPSPSPPAEAYHRFVRDEWTRSAGALNRFLAGHAFASWCAYQGRGLRTFVASLETALGVVAVEAARGCAASARPLDRALLLEAIGRADFLLRHAASREAMTAAWSRAEA